jgi:hypothetical protein
MAKVQEKKAAAKGKTAAKKVVAQVKKAAGAAKKKVAAKKPAASPKPLNKKAAAPPSKKPPTKVVAKVKTAAKVVKAAAKKVVAKAKPAPAPKAKPASLKAAPAKPAPKAKAAAAPAVAAPAVKAAPVVPPRPAAREPEKKRGRRARPRVQSNGVPVAAWLSTEKPRPASFIPAPPRAEAPSAIAAAPASSDRLLRPEDIELQPAVRTVPVRIDVEQAAGRFYVLANPSEVTVRVAEGIEWDFRYLGGADVTVEEIIVEFERPSPFANLVFRTRKPGGARPHRALSGGAVASAAGHRVQYTVRAMTGFKTEVASSKLWMNVTA